MENVSKIKSTRLLSLLGRSVIHGVVGFLIFYLLIASLKYLQIVFGITSVFKMDLYDVLISATGFAMMFLISFLKNFSKDEKVSNSATKILNS